MSRDKIYTFLASHPGHRFTSTQIQNGACVCTGTLHCVLTELVRRERVTKHPKNRDGSFTWSVELDTRPEVRPLAEMTYPGPIFSPPTFDRKTQPAYHQVNGRHWLTESEKLERTAIERGA